MRPLLKAVEVLDNDGNSRMIEYGVYYEMHPEYRGLPVSILKTLVDFENGEAVPDIAKVEIISSLENFDENVVKDLIKAAEEVTREEDIEFL